MFLSLVDDPQIKGHLLINWELPSAPPPFEHGSLDEIHSGMWYERTLAQLVTPNSNDVLCGIILAVDCTHVVDKDKLSLEPVLFSLLIIPRALRNHPFAGRPLGFIPKFSRSQSFGRFNTKTYHRVLGRMLSTLVLAQNKGGIKCTVLHGVDDGTEVELCFKVPLAFVIGDVEGHDVLCAWYHTHNTTMLSRECNCSWLMPTTIKFSVSTSKPPN
jgi:Plavaka transposase